MTTDTKGGRQAQQLRQAIEKEAGTQILTKHLLFSGLTEAITNVSQHAYRNRERYRPWWMSAAYKRDSNTVVVSFYDHGRTIPGTLPASRLFEQIKLNFYLWNDGEKIAAAMQMGRTSTGTAGRGKGLQNFLEVIEAHKGSRLLIISRRGKLTVSNCGDTKLKYESSQLRTSLPGTLIEWRFVPKYDKDDLNSERLLGCPVGPNSG